MVLAKIELGRDVHCCGRFPKPLITSLVLSKVCGSVDQAVCQVFPKGGFLELPDNIDNSSIAVLTHPYSTSCSETT